MVEDIFNEGNSFVNVRLLSILVVRIPLIIGVRCVALIVLISSVSSIGCRSIRTVGWFLIEDTWVLLVRILVVELVPCLVVVVGEFLVDNRARPCVVRSVSLRPPGL